MIRIEQLDFAVGSFALREVSLHVGPGEYFVLLGPTGSGKTLLVECLCGLNRIDSGRIYIGGADVTRLEPRRRGVGYLPQDYALFPHQTVRRNIRFGLNNRRLTSASIRQQVDQLLEQLGLVHLADRLPGKLSGGEQQRVALARALAIRPQVLLLDEPVSALDEQTRDGLCRLLKQLQKTTQTTTLHVCHNFVEMLTVADRVGIIEQGRILQVGGPQEVLERPNSGRVARFVQAGNLLSARARPDGEWVRLACAGGIEFSAPRSDSGCPPIEGTRSEPRRPLLPTDLRSVPDAREGDVLVMVRPENIHLRAAGAANENLPPGTTVLEGSISDVVDLGPVVKVSLACGTGAELLVLLGKKEYKERHAGVGQRVQLSVRPQDVHVVPQ
jgi:ABC-type Fe3+/spermidine/putrescine transport system ATPase subunit